MAPGNVLVNADLKGLAAAGLQGPAGPEGPAGPAGAAVPSARLGLRVLPASRGRRVPQARTVLTVRSVRKDRPVLPVRRVPRGQPA